VKCRARKNGQLKKNISYITGWAITNIDSIAVVKIGGTPDRKISIYWNGTVPWVRSGEVANCEIFGTTEHITDFGSRESAAKLLPEGSVLVAMIGQGKTRGQAAILRIKAATNQNVCGVVIDHGQIDSRYLWYYFLSRYEESRSYASGGNQPALNGEKIGKFVLNLPPLAEQQAIIERVDKLMVMIKELEKQVFERKDQSEMLMQSVLCEALKQERG
jgi:type I restriction enzyme S subunit